MTSPVAPVVGRKFKTRGGQAARVDFDCADQSGWPFVGQVFCDMLNDWQPESWSRAGYLLDESEPSDFDLVEMLP